MALPSPLREIAASPVVQQYQVWVHKQLPPAVTDFLASPKVQDSVAWAIKPPYGPLNFVHEAHLRGAEWDDTVSPLVYTVATLPLLAMGFLITKPDTRLQRAALGALGLGLYIPTWLRWSFHGEGKRHAGTLQTHLLTPDPSKNMANCALSLYAYFIILKYVEWSLLKGPLVDPRLLRSPSPSAKTRFLSALDMTINYRCIGLGSIGLDDSLGPRNSTLKDNYYWHPRWPPLGRAATVARHLYAVAWNYVMADITTAFLRSVGRGTICVPGGRPNSIALFLEQWDYPEKIIAYIFAMTVMGNTVAFYLGAGHHLIAAIAVGTTLWETSAWDFPIFSYPILSTSINEMWSRRWQQVIRVSSPLAPTTRLLTAALHGRAIDDRHEPLAALHAHPRGVHAPRVPLQRPSPHHRAPWHGARALALGHLVILHAVGRRVPCRACIPEDHRASCRRCVGVALELDVPSRRGPNHRQRVARRRLSGALDLVCAAPRPWRRHRGGGRSDSPLDRRPNQICT